MLDPSMQRKQLTLDANAQRFRNVFWFKKCSSDRKRRKSDGDNSSEYGECPSSPNPNQSTSYLFFGNMRLCVVMKQNCLFDESVVDKTSTSDTPKNGQKSSTQIAQKQVFSRKNLSFFDSVSKLSERPNMTSKLGISVGIGISVTAKLYKFCLRRVNLRLTSDPQ